MGESSRRLEPGLRNAKGDRLSSTSCITVLWPNMDTGEAELCSVRGDGAVQRAIPPPISVPAETRTEQNKQQVVLGGWSRGFETRKAIV